MALAPRLTITRAPAPVRASRSALSCSGRGFPDTETGTFRRPISSATEDGATPCARAIRARLPGASRAAAEPCSAAAAAPSANTRSMSGAGVTPPMELGPTLKP